MTGSVAGVVLAAGVSERMGRPKQLLPFRGSTLVGAVVAAAEASQLAEIVVVVGAHASEVVASLEPERSVIVHNPQFSQGNLSSLRAGLAAAAPCDAVVLLLGDMPQVTTHVIDTVIDAWRDTKTVAAVARYDDGIHHPFLLSSTAIANVADLSGHKPLWGYLTGLDAADRLEVPVAGSAPLDVDTPEDYDALLQSET